MQRSIAEIPEVFDESPASEHARTLAINKTRSLIAKRWHELDDVYFHWSREQVEDFIVDFREFVNELLAIHGDNLPFAPMPSELHIRSLLEDVDKLKRAMRDTEMGDDLSSTPASNASSSSKSSASMIAHEFRFLVNAQSVWTVLKVSRHTLFVPSQLCFYLVLVLNNSILKSIKYSQQ